MTTPTQLKMGFEGIEEVQETKKPELSNGRANKLDPQDRTFHDWYRFVLSFPPHLVRNYIEKFGLTPKSVVLDPFCGTGTTIIETKLAGMKAIEILSRISLLRLKQNGDWMLMYLFQAPVKLQTRHWQF